METEKQLERTRALTKAGFAFGGSSPGVGKSFGKVSRVIKPLAIGGAALGVAAEAAEPVTAWQTFTDYYEPTRQAISNDATNIKALTMKGTVTVNRGEFILNLKTGELSSLGNVFGNESPRQANEFRVVGYFRRDFNLFYNYNVDTDVTQLIFRDDDDHQWKLIRMRAEHGMRLLLRSNKVSSPIAPLPAAM